MIFVRQSLELRAVVLDLVGDFPDQIADCTAAIDLLSQQPENDVAADLVRIRRQRGDAYIRLEKWQEAVDDYSRAMPLDVQRLVRRARAYEALKDWQSAAADWSHVTEANPESARRLADFARRLLRHGEFARARTAFQKSRAIHEGLLQEDPENSVIAEELAFVLLETQNETRWTVLVPTAAYGYRAF